jgi:hypothetical protein
MICIWRRCALVVLALVAFSTAAAAQSPANPDGGAPAAPVPSPTTTDPAVADMEAAVLGSPSPPAETVPDVAPSRPPPGGGFRRRPAEGSAESEEALAAYDRPGVVLELGTGGFAAGELQGGVLLGGRLANGLIVGGIVDYTLASVEVTSGMTISSGSRSRLGLGAGARYALARSADRRVELFGGGELSFVRATVETRLTNVPSQSSSANGFSFVAGPGLRLWVHEQVAIGYRAGLRWTRLSGPERALDLREPGAEPAGSDPTVVTELGFEGAFQLLGIF